MSSTNRGGKREVSDYYATPRKEVLRFLRFMLQLEPEFLSGPVLDPCCGGDDTAPASYPFGLRKLGVTDLKTIDIRQDSRAQLRGISYLRWVPKRKYRLTISNPPFALLEQFVRKSLQEAPIGGWVCYLVPINFLRGKKRNMLWREFMPEYWVVHPCPISFTPNGKTDSQIYAHAVWKVGAVKRFSKMYILPERPLHLHIKGFLDT